MRWAGGRAGIEARLAGDGGGEGRDGGGRGRSGVCRQTGGREGGC